jgi:hypothetical protein
MKTFKEFSDLDEMPHLVIGSDYIDLELEVRSTLSDKEYIQFFKDLFSGKKIPSKVSGELIQVSKNNRKAFAKELLKNSFISIFTKKYYSDIHNELMNMLKFYSK